MLNIIRAGARLAAIIAIIMKAAGIGSDLKDYFIHRSDYPMDFEFFASHLTR